MLVLFIGLGDDRVEVEEKLYFYSVEYCNSVAEELSKRYGHWTARDQASVYCIPTSVKEGTPIFKKIKVPNYPRPPAPPNGMMASTG